MSKLSLSLHTNIQETMQPGDNRSTVCLSEKEISCEHIPYNYQKTTSLQGTVLVHDFGTTTHPIPTIGLNQLESPQLVSQER